MTRFAAPIAEQIWDMKYRFKEADGTPLDGTVEDTWRRIARALAVVEKDADHWENEFYGALEDFKFLPAGRITAGAGTARKVTLFNCFVMGTIPDSMGGIFDMLKEAALTMQQGGGIGYDFSTIRPKGALVTGVAADASGPLSFMGVLSRIRDTQLQKLGSDLDRIRLRETPPQRARRASGCPLRALIARKNTAFKWKAAWLVSRVRGREWCCNGRGSIWRNGWGWQSRRPGPH